MRTRIVTVALVATVLALSLAVAAAVAGKGDPQKTINTADQGARGRCC